jgi:hypothetical protein
LPALPFRFPFETAAYMYLQKQNIRKMATSVTSIHCCKRKTEVANLPLFAANGNGKGKIVFLSGQKSMLIEEICKAGLKET